MGVRGFSIRGVVGVIGAALLLCNPASAGPPYITDDPEPTDTGHWENYLYVEGTRAEGAFNAPGAGIEINYGAFADTQFTWSCPAHSQSGARRYGHRLGAAWRWREVSLHGRGREWLAPAGRILPANLHSRRRESHNTPITELLPIWLQKSFGDWTTFGGGGFMDNPGAGNRDYEIYGWALQRQLTNNFALGAEIFGQSRSSIDDNASMAIGVAALYNISDQWHLVVRSTPASSMRARRTGFPTIWR